MSTILVFDVDGTLTGPRRMMHEDFARTFKTVCRTYKVFLVSGSDMPKLEQQLPREVIDLAAGIFPCLGNEFLMDGVPVYKMEHFFPDELTAFLQEYVDNSDYGTRTGNHLETRTGSINVSVVGRNADPRQRKEYFSHDAKSGERQALIDAIRDRFPDYEGNIGGQISVDVTPRGWNKSRVYHELSLRYPAQPISFFGDNMHFGGNDRPLGDAVLNGLAHNNIYAVDDHYDTWKILQDEYFVGIERRRSSRVA